MPSWLSVVCNSNRLSVLRHTLGSARVALSTFGTVVHVMQAHLGLNGERHQALLKARDVIIQLIAYYSNGGYLQMSMNLLYLRPGKADFRLSVLLFANNALLNH